MNNGQAERRVQGVVQSDRQLGTVIKAEPVVLDLLKLAAAQNNRANRWQMYEVLKYTCSQYVGWHAAKPELRNTLAYEQVIQALDTLLPMPMLDEETITDYYRGTSLQQLRDAVIMLCPHIQLPETLEEETNENHDGEETDEDYDRA